MNTELKQKVQCYELYGDTLENLVEKANQIEDRWGAETLLTIQLNNLEDMDEEQREKQMRHNWDRYITAEIRITDQMIYDAVREKMFGKVLGGVKENILNSTYDEILKSRVQEFVSFYKDTGKDILKVRTDTFFLTNEHYIFDVVDNKKEMEKNLKNTKNTAWNYGSRTNEEDVILLEHIKVDMRRYNYTDAKEKVRKAIKKVAANELTYCLKSGNVIVPDEYLNKGEAGIKEWIDIKRSGNKNNSIEKQMLKEAAAKKRAFAQTTMYRTMHTLLSANEHDWSMPNLEIDGRYNKTRTQKLVTKILDTKDRQKLFDTSEEEILNKFKEYWKDVLMNAYNAVDTMKLEEE